MTDEHRNELMNATNEIVATARDMKEQAHRLELSAIGIRQGLSSLPVATFDPPAPDNQPRSIDEIMEHPINPVGNVKASVNGSWLISPGTTEMLQFTVGDTIGSTFWFSVGKQASSPLATLFRSYKGVALRLLDDSGNPLTKYFIKCGASIGEDRRRNLIGRAYTQPTMIVVNPGAVMWLEMRCDIETQDVGVNYACMGQINPA